MEMKNYLIKMLLVNTNHQSRINQTSFKILINLFGYYLNIYEHLKYSINAIQDFYKFRLQTLKETVSLKLSYSLTFLTALFTQ